jgi:hypothetical protein
LMTWTSLTALMALTCLQELMSQTELAELHELMESHWTSELCSPHRPYPTCCWKMPSCCFRECGLFH